MSDPVTFSVDADRVGWITFDEPGSRANVLGSATLAALESALAGAGASGARAIVITSAKERIFIAGADLRELGSLSGPASAAQYSRRGQRLFLGLERLGAPTVCAIHGACAGGGYELALACTFRLASDSPVTRIGLPETGIGTIPGWGGTARLPRLIGAEAALEHILKARLLPAQEALKAGLVDEVVAAASLRERAGEVALGLAAQGRPGRAPPPEPAGGLYQSLREATVRRTRGRIPAPIAAIDVVERNARLGLEEALENEARAFGEVTAGAVCRNLVRGFFLREAAKKRSLEGWFPPVAAEPAPVGKVGIVGAGVMGSGIAHFLAARGVEIVIRDVKPELVERGMGVVRRLFDESVQLRKSSQDEARAGLARVMPTTRWDGFASCDLVVEAIVEEAGAKRRLFAELDGVVSPAALLASNTSALPIEEIAGHVSNPERTLGIHFFNPVSRMPLVELILGKATSAGSADRALSFVKSVGKSPVICRSSPGFLVTRVLFFYLNEAVRLWEGGVPTESVDSALRDYGWPMGPLRLIDEVGVDVAAFIFSEMEHYFPGRISRTRTCASMMAAGMLGRKNGAGTGFYSYPKGSELLNDVATRALAGPVASRTEDPAAITSRLMEVMASEARRCLDEGVVRSADDVDFALLVGAGFPAFRGGLVGGAPTA
jgi:3-hydroxyacyl-CoA dehydrogenase/enoyl-CoA hydratase/3-hydroxybutyryl-CoA epimerase